MGRALRKLKTFKGKMAEFLDLPQEVMLGLVRISLAGREQMYIENHKGVIEYTPEHIRINTSSGVLSIEGENLLMKSMASADIFITGKVRQMTFLV